MELRHLRYFVAVAEELNFSRAAQRLHVSQPPLSRQVRDLEGELGVALFERSSNKVRLTEAGEFLLGEARQLLRQSEDVIQQVRHLGKSKRERLRIGYIANVQGPVVIEAATRFRARHPGVAVKVYDYTTAEQVTAILSGKIDLGFVGFPEAAVVNGLHVEAVGTTCAVMALPKAHRFARAKAQPLSAFQPEPFITISESAFPGARQYVMGLCAAAGFQPRIVHEAHQPIDVLNLVAIGEGVALVPEQMRRIPIQGVAWCDLRPPMVRADSFVAWNDGQASQLLTEFVVEAKAAYRGATAT